MNLVQDKSQFARTRAVVPSARKYRLNHCLRYQKGFGLVELMVGLVIGLLATLVIMQVFSIFEGQKRTTSGTSDAQTSGSIAIFSMQREVQLAGYGLPLYLRNKLPFKCTTASPDNDADGVADVNHDADAGTPNINLFPIRIIDGGNAAGASDTVIVRYGNTATGGVPVDVLVAPAGGVVGVSSNMGCQNNDIVYAVTGTQCNASRVNDAALAAHPQQINLIDNGWDAAGMVAAIAGVDLNTATALACLGAWNEFNYQVNVATSQLVRRVDGVDAPVASGIVNLQAQYGISASPDSNQITQWIDATAPWDNPGGVSMVCNTVTANRNCIKAIRIAVVSRNDLLEKQVVSAGCSSNVNPNPTGVCAWDATSALPIIPSPAPNINLANTADWNRYRYRVYETIVPLRNMVWTRERLEL